MKKVYFSPEIEVETYKLNESIAANCAITVNNGPALGDQEQCSDYEDVFEMALTVDFYEGSCDCYTTAGGQYWTS